MKRLLLVVLAMMFVFAATASAQPSDTDGDGVPDIRDACPRWPGPPPTGCPVPTATPPSLPTSIPDTDGDGFVDTVDACPTVFGTNNGCPVDSAPANPVATVPPPAPSITYRPAPPPADGKCYATPATDSIVNVRQSPSTSASILGRLAPNQHKEVLAIAQSTTDTANVIWYQVVQDGGTGFVASAAVVIQGECRFLTTGRSDITPDRVFEPDAPEAFEFGRVRGRGFAGYTPFEMPAEDGSPGLALIPPSSELPLLMVIPIPEDDGGGFGLVLPRDGSVVFGRTYDGSDGDRAPRDTSGRPTIDVVPAFVFPNGRSSLVGRPDGSGGDSENLLLRGMQFGLTFRQSPTLPPAFLGSLELALEEDAPSFGFSVLVGDTGMFAGVGSLDAWGALATDPFAPTPTPAPTALPYLCYTYVPTPKGIFVKIPFKEGYYQLTEYDMYKAHQDKANHAVDVHAVLFKNQYMFDSMLGFGALGTLAPATIVMLGHNAQFGTYSLAAMTAGAFYKTSDLPPVYYKTSGTGKLIILKLTDVVDKPLVFILKAHVSGVEYPYAPYWKIYCE